MKVCPACGSMPEEEHWGACSEIKGTCWQTGSIDCSNPECHHGVAISIDSDIMKSCSTLLEEMWDLAATNKFKRD